MVIYPVGRRKSEEICCEKLAVLLKGQHMQGVGMFCDEISLTLTKEFQHSSWRQLAYKDQTSGSLFWLKLATPTHPRILLGTIRYDLDMISVHIIAEEIVQVCLRPLTPKHIQTAISLLMGTEIILVSQKDPQGYSCTIARSDARTHHVEEHAVSDPRLYVLRPSVARVLP